MAYLIEKGGGGGGKYIPPIPAPLPPPPPIQTDDSWYWKWLYYHKLEAAQKAAATPLPAPAPVPAKPPLPLQEELTSADIFDQPDPAEQAAYIGVSVVESYTIFRRTVLGIYDETEPAAQTTQQLFRYVGGGLSPDERGEVFRPHYGGKSPDERDEMRIYSSTQEEKPLDANFGVGTVGWAQENLVLAAGDTSQDVAQQVIQEVVIEAKSYLIDLGDVTGKSAEEVVRLYLEQLYKKEISTTYGDENNSIAKWESFLDTLVEVVEVVEEPVAAGMMPLTIEILEQNRYSGTEGQVAYQVIDELKSLVSDEKANEFDGMTLEEALAHFLWLLGDPENPNTDTIDVLGLSNGDKYFFYNQLLLSFRASDEVNTSVMDFAQVHAQELGISNPDDPTEVEGALRSDLIQHLPNYDSEYLKSLPLRVLVDLVKQETWKGIAQNPFNVANAEAVQSQITETSMLPALPLDTANQLMDLYDDEKLNLANLQADKRYIYDLNLALTGNYSSSADLRLLLMVAAAVGSIWLPPLAYAGAVLAGVDVGVNLNAGRVDEAAKTVAAEAIGLGIGKLAEKAIGWLSGVPDTVLSSQPSLPENVGKRTYGNTEYFVLGDVNDITLVGRRPTYPAEYFDGVTLDDGTSFSWVDVNTNPNVQEYNCVNCSIAVAETISGNPVGAAPLKAGQTGASPMGAMKLYGRDFTYVGDSVNLAEDVIITQMQQLPEGAHALVLGARADNSGHMWNVVKTMDGEIVFVDAQGGGIPTNYLLDNYFTNYFIMIIYP